VYQPYLISNVSTYIHDTLNSTIFTLLYFFTPMYVLFYRNVDSNYRMSNVSSNQSNGALKKGSTTERRTTERQMIERRMTGDQILQRRKTQRQTIKRRLRSNVDYDQTSTTIKRRLRSNVDYDQTSNVKCRMPNLPLGA
jgi:hypothetical protein